MKTKCSTIQKMKKIIITSLLLTIAQLSFGQKTILWKVTDTLNNKTSAIVGTFHQFGNSFVDSIPKLKELLYQSEIAVFEALDDHGKFRQVINSRPDTDIEKKLKNKTYRELVELSKNWEINIKKFRPIELRYKLEQEYAKSKCKTVKETDTWDHFDNYLQFLATKNKIDVLGLESFDEQIDFISEEHKSPIWKKEKKAIQYLIEQLNSPVYNKSKCALADNYRKFNLDYRFESDCMMEVLLKERNDNWMKTLPNLLRKKNCFIAVGLFHLYNSCGLLEQLKAKGFLVEPIDIITNNKI